jgi:hypothetical protein
LWCGTGQGNCVASGGIFIKLFFLLYGVGVSHIIIISFDAALKMYKTSMLLRNLQGGFGSGGGCFGGKILPPTCL